MGSWQRDGSTATTPRSFWCCFPSHPILHVQMSHRAARSHHKTQKNPGKSPGESHAMGLGPGLRSRGRAEECTRRANNSCGIILTAPSSAFGGVAVSGMRSGQSCSCSHNLLLFRTSFFPQISTSSCGTVPAPIMGCPGARPRVLMSRRGSELSVPLLRVRLKQPPTASCWNRSRIHPLCCCPVASRSRDQLQGDP